MKTRRIFRTRNLLRCLVLTALGVVLMPQLSLAGAVGEFTVVKGRVDLLKPGEMRAQPVVLGDGVFLKDVVRTKSGSRARITFADETVLNMAEKSRVEIKEFLFQPGKKRRAATLRAFRGVIRAATPEGWKESDPHFQIETPTSVAAVRGTDFFVVIKGPFATEIIVLEGHVAVMHIDPEILGVVIVGPHQMTTVRAHHPPAPPRHITDKAVTLLLSATDAEHGPDEGAPEPEGGDVDDVDDGSGDGGDDTAATTEESSVTVPITETETSIIEPEPETIHVPFHNGHPQ